MTCFGSSCWNLVFRSLVALECDDPWPWRNGASAAPIILYNLMLSFLKCLTHGTCIITFILLNVFARKPLNCNRSKRKEMKETKKWSEWSNITSITAAFKKRCRWTENSTISDNWYGWMSHSRHAWNSVNCAIQFNNSTKRFSEAHDYAEKI